FSLMSFTDGTTVLDCPPVQDHKRAFAGDKGANTGGMGSYSDANHLLPFLKKEHIEKAHEITVQIAKALKQEFGPYHGVMYGGFILTSKGVKVIEYNARLGDPEAMNVLSILESDFCELCRAITTETLEGYDLQFKKLATVCKYAVPNGYPEKPVKGAKIEIPSDIQDVSVYLASVDQKDDGLHLLGSRAVACVGVGKTIAEAEKKAEFAVSLIKGPVFHRDDIGTKELIQKRVDHMKRIADG
ncbi:MAG: phosphoribosylglycinamide synthetase C domain-containing protein, partial [Nanoarchaeota archaeon]|nr:phosphoribosylglycinamide synthetase C domain-containing protein [Nanoarchaeota archaeon]